MFRNNFIRRCILAGLASGFYKNLEEIKAIHSYQAIFNPNMDEETVNKKYRGWLKAVEATRVFKNI